MLESYFFSGGARGRDVRAESVGREAATGKAYQKLGMGGRRGRNLGAAAVVMAVAETLRLGETVGHRDYFTLEGRMGKRNFAERPARHKRSRFVRCPLIAKADEWGTQCVGRYCGRGDEWAPNVWRYFSALSSRAFLLRSCGGRGGGACALLLRERAGSVWRQ